MWQDAKNIYHYFQAIIANILYGFPSRGLTIIGVTGTDGKTTTASLMYHILTKAGKKAALISSVGALINGKSSDIGFHVTTPGRFALQSYIKRAKKEGVHYVVLEMTSHALHQHRAAGVHFDVGVLTNITNEHLDYHKTYERYVAAKAKLLRKAKVAIVNKEDRSYSRIKNHELRKKHKKIVTYGIKRDAKVNPHVFPFKTKLLGKFNIYNSLAAVAAMQQLHIPDEVIRQGLASFTPPQGRQEVVYAKDFIVINDFAHTPNSFANILPEVRKTTKGRLIHVFGCAALRDAYKRPEMGMLSSKYADIIIVTAEDPRNEPVGKIIDEIIAGIKERNFEVIEYHGVQSAKSKAQSGKKYIFKIPDRKEAITFAISLAQKGDTVLLTGKGHEKSINYGKGEEPWNETETALEAIHKRSKQ